MPGYMKVGWSPDPTGTGRTDKELFTTCLCTGNSSAVYISPLR